MNLWSFNFRSIFLSSLALLATGIVCKASVPAALHAEAKVPYTCGAIKADPSRNIVYLVDQTDNRILAIDTTVGVVVKTVSIEDGNTFGNIVISPDDSTLYLLETGEDKVLSFSLPNLTPAGSVSIGFQPACIAVGTGGRLYASHVTNSDGVISELSTTDGSVLQTFGNSESFLGAPLLRTNASGTNLYAADTGYSGFMKIYKYDITGAAASSATGYEYESENLEDFAPDETNQCIYAMNGGIYGVNVIKTATDDYSTVWPLSGVYGTAVSFSENGTGNTVFGAAGDFYTGDVEAYSRADGAPVTDNLVTATPVSIMAQGVAATPNGNAVYVRQEFENANTYVGIIGVSNISPNPDPLKGVYVGGGFFYNSQLGYYNEGYYPWIFHENLGWIYVDVPNPQTSDVYLYLQSLNLGWVYTNPTDMSYLYCFYKSGFLYYFEGTNTFYNTITGQFESHAPAP